MKKLRHSKPQMYLRSATQTETRSALKMSSRIGL